MKKIVVTGALGHIGSYVIRDFASQFPGTEIVMIDNMMTQRFASLFNLPESGLYNFIEADVREINLKSLLHNAHVVIHLAAITDAAGSFGNASEIEANNFISTSKVAEACADCGVRMITLSSTSVYGTQKDVVSEDCSPLELQPQSPYAATKLKEEQLVSSLKQKGLQAATLRFGTIFGPSVGMRFHTAVNKFCWQAVMGLPLTVWSTAYEQKRPYLDLSDASNALAFIIRQDLFDGRIYNVLSHNLTVHNIVETIRGFIPAVDVSFVDNEIMNQLSYEVSCKRFESQGFTFNGDIKSGIDETISFLNQTQSAHR